MKGTMWGIQQISTVKAGRYALVILLLLHMIAVSANATRSFARPLGLLQEITISNKISGGTTDSLGVHGADIPPPQIITAQYMQLILLLMLTRNNNLKCLYLGTRIDELEKVGVGACNHRTTTALCTDWSHSSSHGTTRLLWMPSRRQVLPNEYK